ncbi:hypothetical protein ACHAXT_005743 [Thalassiosira profunda]
MDLLIGYGSEDSSTPLGSREGKKKYANGDVYEGEWTDGQPNGQGRMIYFKRRSGDKGAEYYEGEWKDGKPHGKGMCTYRNGRYEGEFEDGRRTGKGTYKWANGEEYVGEWKVVLNDDEMRHGTGTHKFTNGSDYTGEWRENKRNGTGTHRSTNGDEYTGEWKDGKKHGAGTLKEANGTTHKQEYSKGELLSSKRVASTTDDVPPSQRPQTNETVGVKPWVARGVVTLDDNEMGCWNCGEDYSFDMDATEDDDARKRLPVITSCDHTCCHGCILHWQVSRAENNNGRVAKRVPCMLCKKKSAICPSEPKYDRRLIDLLGRCSR